MARKNLRKPASSKSRVKKSSGKSRARKTTTKTKKRATSSSRRKMSTASRGRKRGKVGSDRNAARRVGGKLDFGAPEDNLRERQYVSEETKRSDPGAAPIRIKTTGPRESGVGAPESGPGGASGGDLDPDIVGVGFGGSGVAQTGPTRTEGPDITTTGGSEPFAAPGPKGHRPSGPPRIERVRGSTVDHSGGDISTTGGGLDASSVTNPQARNDDSFAADINDDEARGAENDPQDRADRSAQRQHNVHRG